MFSLLKSGGLLMLPILICGILATYIIVERVYYFISIKKRDLNLLSELPYLFDKKDYPAIEACCIRADTPCSSVIRRAVMCRNWTVEELKEEVQTALDSAVPRFEHFLTPLGTIANISTLLGLLGTVIGNIKAFGLLGAGASMGNPEVLASSIAQALVTTAAGLTVSIPAVIFHNYFISRVNRRVTEMEAAVTHALFRLTGRNI